LFEDINLEIPNVRVIPERYDSAITIEMKILASIHSVKNGTVTYSAVNNWKKRIRIITNVTIPINR